jgi:hypothetical protein
MVLMPIAAFSLVRLVPMCGTGLRLGVVCPPKSVEFVCVPEVRTAAVPVPVVMRWPSEPSYPAVLKSAPRLYKEDSAELELFLELRP